MLPRAWSLHSPLSVHQPHAARTPCPVLTPFFRARWPESSWRTRVIPSHPPPLPAELRAQPGWKKSSQHGLSVPSTCPSSKAMLNGVTCHPVSGCCPSHRLSWQDTLCLGHPYNACVKLLLRLICRRIDFHQQSSHFNFCVTQSIMCSKPPPGSLEACVTSKFLSSKQLAQLTPASSPANQVVCGPPVA